jgi:hypothetical protein
MALDCVPLVELGRSPLGTRTLVALGGFDGGLKYMIRTHFGGNQPGGAELTARLVERVVRGASISHGNLLNVFDVGTEGTPDGGTTR